MGGWNEHYKFNQYKVKLNEVFDNLDEIIYISSTIDYKKVNILLYKIVQNFDYYNYYIPPPEEEKPQEVPTSSVPPVKTPEPDEQQVPPVKTRVLYGGRGINFGRGRGSALPPKETPNETPNETPKDTPQETPNETPNETPKDTPQETPKDTPNETPPETPPETPQETPNETLELVPQPPKEQPYSSIDTDEMIDIIMKDQEYQDLIAYIDGVQTNIRRKCGNLIEIINPLTEYLNDKTIENRLILQDYLKQHETIKTKLKTIQENIREINYGIRKKYKIPPRKIKFDVILIPNTIEWEIFKYILSNSSLRYYLNRYFYTKQIHVLKDDLSKANIDEFENKLKKLYNDLFIKFNEYIRENKNDKPIMDKLKGSLVEDAEDQVDDADNPGAMEDYPDTQPIQTLLDMLEEKRGSVSKLFVKPQQQRPQQPYNPQPSAPHIQQPPQPPYNPQQPPPYIQPPPQQPKEPILNQLTEEITEKIKNKKDTTTQDLIEGAKNAKEGVASFITGLSANGKIGNVKDVKEGASNIMKGFTNQANLGDLANGFTKGKFGDATNIMKGFTDNIPGKANLGDLANGFTKGKFGDASSIIEGKIPDLASAKSKFANLAKGNLGDASSIIEGKIPDLASAKSKFANLAKGNLGDASSIIEGKIPDLASAKSKFANLAKDKFKGLIP
jgi:hypothetical protein